MDGRKDGRLEGWKVVRKEGSKDVMNEEIKE
jgi:hypothetical protein